MNLKKRTKEFISFLREDSYPSLIVSIILIILIIKLIFFPLLSFITGTPLPLVVVESCSMYHETDFETWWEKNEAWYTNQGISKEDFEKYPFKEGLNKGDIIFVWGRGNYSLGDIIIFNALAKYPIIHRAITAEPYSTKGDHNSDQISYSNGGNIDETNISEDQILGKAIGKIPLIGWIKLIIFEPFRNPSERGFCK